jgi:DNA-binding winged helix-turn-helix (wHTH) protein
VRFLLIRAVSGIALRSSNGTCSMSGADKHVYTFGPFEVDFKNAVLMQRGNELAIRPKLLEVLRVFIERGNELVTILELQDGLWLESPSPQNISKAISELRAALGDTSHTYIKTVRGRG